MKFTPIASGSSGNCYHLTSGSGSTLLIEAGISFKKIQRALNFKTSDIEGCLISHSHKDHCLAEAVKDLLRSGIDCYMLESTRKDLGIEHHRIHIIEPKVQFRIGDFLILPFDTVHDVENIGFLIQDKHRKRLLYVTDTPYVKYRFNGINILAVECNYSDELLEENILKGIVPEAMRERLRRSHFSLKNCKEFLKSNDLKTVDEIWLIHLSNNNSDAEQFKTEIERHTRKPVYIA